MNWKNIISDLISAGYTQVQIAKEAGISQSTIAGLSSGDQHDMRWSNGNQLLTLHKRVMQVTALERKESTHA